MSLARKYRIVPTSSSWVSEDGTSYKIADNIFYVPQGPLDVTR